VGSLEDGGTKKEGDKSERGRKEKLKEGKWENGFCRKKIPHLPEETCPQIKAEIRVVGDQKAKGGRGKTEKEKKSRLHS